MRRLAHRGLAGEVGRRCYPPFVVSGFNLASISATRRSQRPTSRMIDDGMSTANSNRVGCQMWRKSPKWLATSALKIGPAATIIAETTATQGG